jgi:hypothetical protein
MSGLPGGHGLLYLDVVVVDVLGMGTSLPNENLITVSSRMLDGSPMAQEIMLHGLVHEVGHKIGMVPGPLGDSDLDEQPYYYHGCGHEGPHCRFPAPIRDYTPSRFPLLPAPACTMFGDLRSNTDMFCPNCLPPVRKLDVSPGRRTGIGNQF